MVIKEVLSGLALLAIAAFAVRRQSRPQFDTNGTPHLHVHPTPSQRQSVVLKKGRGVALFLDIDGVLHPKTSGSLEYLPNLEALLRRNPDLDLVISSTWRETMKPEALTGLFSSDIAQRIVGFTPVLPGQSRQNEVIAFACETGIRHWIAIDDREDEFSPGCPWLFKTSTDTGLDRNATAALELKLASMGMRKEQHG